MIRIVAYFEPEFDFSHVVKEWCAEASKELDFNQEAKKSEQPDAFSTSLPFC